MTTRNRKLSRTARRPQSRRDGITIVELLVSIVIFTVGVLGLTKSMTDVTRMMGGGAQQTLAAMVAQSRFDKLQSQSCVALTDGSDVTRGVSTQWTVQPVARGRSVTVTVTFTTPRGRRTRTYRSILPC